MRGGIVKVGLLLLSIAGAASPQSPASQPDSAKPDSAKRVRHWVVGMSLGVPGYGNEAAPMLTTVGVHGTEYRPGRVGGDFSVGTMPAAISFGVVPLGVRMGIAVPLENRQAGFAVVPSAGTSILGVFSPGGEGDWTIGLNAGLATIIWSGSVGFRSGVTVHQFAHVERPVWLLELGFVGAPTSG